MEGELSPTPLCASSDALFTSPVARALGWLLPGPIVKCLGTNAFPWHADTAMIGPLFQGPKKSLPPLEKVQWRPSKWASR